MLLLAVVLAGCGGGGGDVRVVRGAGYRFEAPAGWKVTRSGRTSAARHGAVARVQVTTFPLVRRYRPELFAAAAIELDRAARDLAEQLGGRVTADRTVQVAGRDSRTYTIRYRGKAQEITFVLDGRREYQLLCRRREGGDDEPCRRLVSSFRLA